jgi:hypothetical protein
MWDLALNRPRGGVAWRQFLAFVTAVVVATFGSLILFSQTTFAADATWRGDSIIYESNQYSGPSRGRRRGQSRSTIEVVNYLSTSSEPDARHNHTAHVIYFLPNEH